MENGAIADVAATLTFRYWFLCVVALYMKMFANSVVQGIYRVRNKAYTRPDDAVFFGKDAPIREADLPIVQRASACWRNDLENIPIFLLIALAFTLTGGQPGFALFYFGIFTLSRIAHTIFYLRPTQPWRNLVYQVGVYTTLATAIHTGIRLFL